MIYVDDLFKVHRDLWCHMATDGDLRELHLMARKLGLRAEWFQDKNRRHPHYDLKPRLRAAAIRLGAQPVSSVELVQKCFPLLPQQLAAGTVVAISAQPQKPAALAVAESDPEPGDQAYSTMLGMFEEDCYDEELEEHTCEPEFRCREWHEALVWDIQPATPGLYKVEILYHLLYNLDQDIENGIEDLADEVWRRALTLEEINAQRRERCDYCCGVGEVDGSPCAGCPPWE